MSILEFDDKAGAASNKGFYDTLKKYANLSENSKADAKPETDAKQGVADTKIKDGVKPKK